MKYMSQSNRWVNGPPGIRCSCLIAPLAGRTMFFFASYFKMTFASSAGAGIWAEAPAAPEIAAQPR